MRSDEWAQLEQAASGGVPTVGTEPGGISLWFSTRGRISRSTYWLKFVLPLTGMQIVAAVLDVKLGFDDPDEIGPVGRLLFLLILWPVMVSLVKRLHDLDHPGWFVAAFYGGIFAGGVIAAIVIPALGDVALILGIPLLVLILMGFWYGIKISFFRGTIGPNRYGPDPLATWR